MFSISDTVIDTLYNQQYVYIPSKVVNSTYTYSNNHLTLNKGSNNGICFNVITACRRRRQELERVRNQAREIHLETERFRNHLR